MPALVDLGRSAPDILISDLRMPNISGFELLSIIRRRFPHIPVVAISGEFHGIAPEGLIADHFFSKGSYRSEELFEKIAELIARAPIRPHVAKAGLCSSVGATQCGWVFCRYVYRLLAIVFNSRTGSLYRYSEYKLPLL